MSARLLKTDSGPIPAFQPFAFPERDVLELYGFDASTNLTPAIEPDAEAERIIADAKAQAAQIERDTREQLQSLVAAEVDAQVIRVVDPWRDLLKQSIEDLVTFRSVMAKQTEVDLVRLALAIARKVIHREVTTDPETVVSVARAALSRIQHRIPVTIHLNADDFAYLSQHPELLETGHALTLVEDKAVARGGCLIHAENGEVDARIDQQFAEIETALLHD